MFIIAALSVLAVEGASIPVAYEATEFTQSRAQAMLERNARRARARQADREASEADARYEAEQEAERLEAERLARAQEAAEQQRLQAQQQSPERPSTPVPAAAQVQPQNPQMR